MPTFRCYRNRELLDQVEGAQPQKMIEMLEKHRKTEKGDGCGAPKPNPNLNPKYYKCNS